MNRLKLDTWRKAAVNLIRLGFAVWLVETVFFLLRDGWHLKAETHAEALCDMGAVSMVHAGLLVWLVCKILLLFTPNNQPPAAGGC